MYRLDAVKKLISELDLVCVNGLDADRVVGHPLRFQSAAGMCPTYFAPLFGDNAQNSALGVDVGGSDGTQRNCFAPRMGGRCIDMAFVPRYCSGLVRSFRVLPRTSGLSGHAPLLLELEWPEKRVARKEPPARIRVERLMGPKEMFDETQREWSRACMISSARLFCNLVDDKVFANGDPLQNDSSVDVSFAHLNAARALLCTRGLWCARRESWKVW